MKNRTTNIYYILFILVGMMAGLLGPLIPYLSEQAEISISKAGGFLSLFAIGSMFGAFFSSKILTLSRPSRGVAIFLGVFIAVMSSFYLSSTYTIYLILSFMLGGSQGIVNSAGNSIILRVWKKESGPKISTLHFFYGVGNIVIPIMIIGSALYLGSDSYIFPLLISIAAPLMLTLFNNQLPESEDGSNSEFEEKRSPYLPLFLSLFALYVGIELTIGGWITTYGILKGMDSESAKSLPSIFWASLTFGRLLLIYIIKVVVDKTILLTSSILAALSGTLFFLDSNIALYLAPAFVGLFISTYFPALYSYGSKFYNLEGRNTSLVFISAGIGGMSMPYVTGFFIEYFGNVSLTYVVVSLLSLWVLVFVVLNKLLSKLK